jgi:hypothetical protein
MTRHLDLFPKLPSILWLVLLFANCSEARPLVRHIRSTHGTLKTEKVSNKYLTSFKKLKVIRFLLQNLIVYFKNMPLKPVCQWWWISTRMAVARVG